MWNYYKDKLSDDTNDNNNPNKNVINSEFFKYKTSNTGSTYNVDARITNVEGNVVNNPAYDANKSGKKEVKSNNKIHEGYFFKKCNISNNRHKIVCSSCYSIS